MKVYKFRLTLERFTTKLAELKADIGDGVKPLSATTGKVHYRGVDGSYSYQVSVGELMVEIDHKPILLSEQTMEKKLNSWFLE